MKTITNLMLGALCAILPLCHTAAQEAKSPVLGNGIKYLGTPYVAHTLEEDGPEDLVINCDEVDCITLVEYALAESLTPRLPDGDISETDFGETLIKIRYRDGRIDGYASRLHYVSDWIANGVRAGFLEDVTATHGSAVQKLSLSYMSSHPQQYKQLANSPQAVAQIKAVERSLSGTSVRYLPKDKLPVTGLNWIKDGDIIAITTSQPGLDVSHMGIAFYVGDKLTLLHASSTSGKVEISKQTLSQMLKDNSRATGIRVVRMKQ